MKVLCLIILAIKACNVANMIWNSVYVDQKYFQETDLYHKVTTVKLAYGSKSLCASICLTREPCKLFCLDELICNISSWLVSPRYVAATSSATFRCYTALEEDFIYNNVVISDTTVIYPLSNLLDGIYAGNVKYCFKGTIKAMTTIKIELGTLVNIKEITFTTCYVDDPVYNPSDLKIVVMNKSTPQQPGVLYGTFPSTVTLDTTYSFKNSSITGDTIGLGVWVPNADFGTMLCHMQVF